MIKSIVKITLLSITAMAIAALPLQAADQPEGGKPEAGAAGKKAAAPRFSGILKAKTDSSITVGERTFQVTSETKIKKEGKPATLADAEVGKEAAGSFADQDGKLVAKTLRLGPAVPRTPKPEGDMPPKAE